MVFRVFTCIVGWSGLLQAQSPTLTGQVVERAGASPIGGATVSIIGTAISATTGANGRFALRGVPAGPQRLRIVRFGRAPLEADVAVGTENAPLSFAMDMLTTVLADVSVTAVSRVPERLVDAPAAVSQLDPETARDLAIMGQPALALTTMPGVNVIQSDVQDFNINARGFNTVFNRRVLVLLDGRDLAINFLGSQEWLGLSATLADMQRVEFVRGPTAALYGANSFAGVLDMTTRPARETPGSMLSVAGGGLASSRIDARHGNAIGDGRWAYRVTGGYSRSDAWAKSRTNVGDLRREYADAVDTTNVTVDHPFPGYELAPLIGQEKSGAFGLPGVATGSADPVTSTYGTARLDRYLASGAVVTAEAGTAIAKNATLVGSGARFQIGESQRPWARLAVASDRFHLGAYYSGRDASKQRNLAAGTESTDRSHTVHLEGQFNRQFGGDRGRVVGGASWRTATVNTNGTLVDPAYDDRGDHFTAAFGQVDYRLTPRLRLVGAARLDESNLFDAQFSPKAALVYALTPTQSLRLTYGRAFEMPNTLDFFVALPAGPPADFRALEDALRASPLGPALANVPQGTLFTISAAVPVLALGNPGLDVERVASYEIGYKGQAGPVFLTVDAYYSRMNGFVTDLLPGANPAFGPWSAPAEVPLSARAAVEGAVRDALLQSGQPLAAYGLTRRETGATAIVLSIGNAGRATVRGVEIAAALNLAGRWTVDGNVSLVRHRLEASSLVPGDVVEPNTPNTTANLGVTWRNPGGLSATVTANLTSGFEWSTGVFNGPVPAAQSVTASASYPITNAITATLVGSNLLDDRHYENFGGAVLGRRVMAGLTARF